MKPLINVFILSIIFFSCKNESNRTNVPEDIDNAKEFVGNFHKAITDKNESQLLTCFVDDKTEQDSKVWIQINDSLGTLLKTKFIAGQSDVRIINDNKEGEYLLEYESEYKLKTVRETFLIVVTGNGFLRIKQYRAQQLVISVVYWMRTIIVLGLMDKRGMMRCMVKGMLIRQISGNMTRD